MADSVASVLADREVTYGDFGDVAAVAQALKAVGNWERLSPAQAEALAMIMTKIARMLCGDPNHEDTIVDIGGYAALMLEDIRKRSRYGVASEVEKP